MELKIDNLYDIEGSIYKYLGDFTDEWGKENLVFVPTTGKHSGTFKVKVTSDPDQTILLNRFNLGKEDRVKIMAYNKHIIRKV